jgi:tetratricopeptide (TPR) repeat protein
MAKVQLEIRREILGEAHPEYAYSLSHLGVLYRNMGDYAKAEPLLRKALEVGRAVKGTLNADYARDLSALAMLYATLGEHAKAEPLLRQALQIRRQVLGEPIRASKRAWII